MWMQASLILNVISVGADTINALGIKGVGALYGAELDPNVLAVAERRVAQLDPDLPALVREVCSLLHCFQL